MRILTFNTHEATMYDVAKTGHQFDVASPPSRGPWGADWDTRSRPAPPNVRLLGPVADLPALVRAERYDLVLPQTFEQALLVARLGLPTAVLFHTFPPYKADDPSVGAAMQRLWMEYALSRCSVTFVSEPPRLAWRLPGETILHLLDPADYRDYAYTGEIPAVLTVAHFYKERDAEHGFSLHQAAVCDDIPYKIIGINPTLPNSGPAPGWHDLKRAYQTHRVYLNTTAWGASLSMFEGMAAGMPVVSTPRDAGVSTPLPVRDGYNGFVASDARTMRERLLYLLARPDVCHEMGERGREIVYTRNSVQSYTQAWEAAFARAKAGGEGLRSLEALPEGFAGHLRLVADPQASAGRAVEVAGDGGMTPVMFGPYVRLAPGRQRVPFAVRAAESSASVPLRSRLQPRLRVDVATDAGRKVHAERLLGAWPAALSKRYQTVYLDVESDGTPADWEFRVFALGRGPFRFDPYVTWRWLLESGLATDAR